MQYEKNQEWLEKTFEIIDVLELKNIDKERIGVITSKGSKSNAIARIYSIGKAVQLGLDCKAGYVIELVEEKFWKQNEEDRIKTIIHELLHIPAKFKGGFVHHGKYHNRKIIDIYYNKYKESKKEF